MNLHAYFTQILQGGLVTIFGLGVIAVISLIVVNIAFFKMSQFWQISSGLTCISTSALLVALLLTNINNDIILKYLSSKLDMLIWLWCGFIFIYAIGVVITTTGADALDAIINHHDHHDYFDGGSGGSGGDFGDGGDSI